MGGPFLSALMGTISFFPSEKLIIYFPFTQRVFLLLSLFGRKIFFYASRPNPRQVLTVL
jgi:hypothetical protein